MNLLSYRSGDESQMGISLHLMIPSQYYQGCIPLRDSRKEAASLLLQLLWSSSYLAQFAFLHLEVQEGGVTRPCVLMASLLLLEWYWANTAKPESPLWVPGIGNNRALGLNWRSIHFLVGTQVMGMNSSPISHTGGKSVFQPDVDRCKVRDLMPVCLNSNSGGGLCEQKLTHLILSHGFCRSIPWRGKDFPSSPTSKGSSWGSWARYRTWTKYTSLLCLSGVVVSLTQLHSWT